MRSAPRHRTWVCGSPSRVLIRPLPSVRSAYHDASLQHQSLFTSTVFCTVPQECFAPSSRSGNCGPGAGGGLCPVDRRAINRRCGGTDRGRKQRGAPAGRQRGRGGHRSRHRCESKRRISACERARRRANHHCFLRELPEGEKDCRDTCRTNGYAQRGALQPRPSGWGGRCSRPPGKPVSVGQPEAAVAEHRRRPCG